MSPSIAVALSVYKSDSANHLAEAINSVIEQSVNCKLFIQVDGTIPSDLSNVLKGYSNNNKVSIIFNDKNLGLATRLNEIIELCLKEGTYLYLARMDADDICFPERFEKQVNFLNDNPEISVVGSDVTEISDSGEELFNKKMDSFHKDLANNIIKKCPFNHPSVMFRMDVFQEGFRYKPELLNTQDYYLWVDLLAAGKQFANINEPLLMFRINDSFHTRRGYKKAINDLKSRIYAFKKLDVLTLGNIIHSINLFLLRIAPPSVKKWAYKNLR